MKFWVLGLRAFASGLFGAVLVSCGNHTADTSPPLGSVQQSRVYKSTSNDLLYVVSEGVTEFFTFPQGESVGSTDNGAVGICTDAKGNIWVTNYDGYAYEYAHGGTQIIDTLYFRVRSPLSGCAVNKSTGNLAITVTADYGQVYIFWNTDGTGTAYKTPFPRPYKCAYDDQGNLFVDGSGSTFEVAELPKGASQFKLLSFDAGKSQGAGSIRYDGKYMAISTRVKKRPVLYRFQVAGSAGEVERKTPFQQMWKASSFWIQGKTLIGATRHDVGLWNWPRGGKPYGVLDIQSAQDFAISPGSSH